MARLYQVETPVMLIVPFEPSIPNICAIRCIASAVSPSIRPLSDRETKLLYQCPKRSTIKPPYPIRGEAGAREPAVLGFDSIFRNHSERYPGVKSGTQEDRVVAMRLCLKFTKSSTSCSFHSCESGGRHEWRTRKPRAHPGWSWPSIRDICRRQSSCGLLRPVRV